MSSFDGISEQQRFQLLINSITDYAIYMLDRDGPDLNLEPRCANASRATLPTKSSAEFLASSSRRRIAKPGFRARADVRRCRGRFEAEGWRVRKDGTRFWANAVLDPIFDPTVAHLGFAKITRDITAKQEQERALFESEQRFRLLVQGVRDYAIYMLDTEGRVTNWNSGAESDQGLYGQ